MSIKALQDYIYYSKYARFNKEENRRETWNEAVDRVKNMHLEKYPNVKEEIEWAFDQVRKKLVLGSQRALQFGGNPILKKNARMYNCTVSFCDRLRFFPESFWLLLCGCGVGFSVQKHHIAKLPNFTKVKEKAKKVFVIEDTIEGWADSLEKLIYSYFEDTEEERYEYVFDYSLIRPKGSNLSSGVGKAPGPKPLMNAIESIKKLLDDRVSKYKKLRPIDAYDIVMHSSDAVLSGGVRRSATICIFSHDDEEMIKAKTGNWMDENRQRSRSNNSALLLRDSTTKQEFFSLMDSVKQFGEPGFYFSNSTEQLPNPCFYSDVRILTNKGNIKIIDLFKQGSPNKVYIDKQEKELNLKQASSVSMTQIESKIYELITENNQSIKVTSNHEFVTSNGKKKLSDLSKNDILYLQSSPIPNDAELEGTVEEGKKFALNKTIDQIEKDIDTLFKKSNNFLKGFFFQFFKEHSKLIYSHKESLKNSKIVIESITCDKNLNLLRDFQSLLISIGIVSKISFAKNENSEYELRFFLVLKNYDNLDLDLSIYDYETKVHSIDFCGIDNVYCLTEYDTNTVIANGIVTGNCVEIGMWPVCVETGESGWQMCNLTEINGKKIKTIEDFEIAAKAAAIIGTLQAGYDSFEYLGKVTEDIVRREALLGVSITGMMDSPDLLFDKDIQKEMAKLVVKTNEEFAKKIGINPAARCTCVKPSGTASCVLGTSNGIHPHHAKRYFRRSQGNAMESILQHFEKYNPHAVEKSVWSANDTDKIISFCCEVPDGNKTKNDLSAIDLLNYVKLTQQNWVQGGKVKDRCTQPWLTHNVSNTVTVKEEEWDEVAEFIYDNREYFAGVSLIAHSGDLDYPQAPFCIVHTPKEIFQIYGDCSLFASGLITEGLHLYDNNLWKACDSVLGMGEKLEIENNSFSIEINKKNDLVRSKLGWVKKVKNFSDKYLNGDVKKTTYLMKEVYNWKMWLDLKREYKNVDYTELIENEDNTRPLEEIACSGGKCEVI